MLSPSKRPRRQLSQPSLPPSRFKSFWEESWTKFYGISKIVSGLFIAGWGILGDALRDSEIKQAITSLGLPAKIGFGLAILGFLTLILMPHKDSDAQLPPKSAS